MLEQDRIIKINIEEEMKSSYIDYSMSVIVSRALPDVRDGFKPVHRRILYGMMELGNTSDKPYKKSARIVGEVLGKYHPHGDSSVYFAMVRMAQEWAMRYPLVDGQGNFGSVDGDSPAAMRYTEARLNKLGEAMMDDLYKETVDFEPNFDNTLVEPKVMPTRPRPVKYASRTPLTPYINPPVGKSGALTNSISSSTVISGLSIYASHASITSERL